MQMLNCIFIAKQIVQKATLSLNIDTVPETDSEYQCIIENIAERMEYSNMDDETEKNANDESERMDEDTSEPETELVNVSLNQPTPQTPSITPPQPTFNPDRRAIILVPGMPTAEVLNVPNVFAAVEEQIGPAYSNLGPPYTAQRDIEQYEVLFVFQGK